MFCVRDPKLGTEPKRARQCTDTGTTFYGYSEKAPNPRRALGYGRHILI